MLTKLKKLFSKDEEINSENELIPESSNGEKIQKKEINKTEAHKTENEIREDEVVDPASDTNDTKTKKTTSTVTAQESLDVKTISDSSLQNGKNTKTHSTEEIKEEVIKVLKTCYDPEIPVDVWELGLIYDIKVATNGDVMIIMTLTSPSCPVAGILPGEIEQKVKEHPMVNDSKVQLTFDPPWSQKNMSEVAKLELGFL